MNVPENAWWAADLAVRWSATYRSEWDDQPDAYIAAGIVRQGRSRRLLRCDDPTCAFKAYVGVHHNEAQETGQARFFLSLFVLGRTISLRTYSTFPEAIAALQVFHQRLRQGGAS